MGLDLLETSAGQQRFAQAEEILGWSVPQMCQSHEEQLSCTLYTQPCLYVVSAILADLLRIRGECPDLVAGHSLGEYVALYVAGVFSFEEGLRLVKRRAELMDSTSEGTMAALVGFDRQQLETIIAETQDAVLANDNHPGQVVISGTTTAIDAVLARLKVKKVIQLKVSGAFHSPLMVNAANQFRQILAEIPFLPARIPVLSNVEPTPTTEAAVLKARLMEQMTGPVRWRETSLRLAEAGVERVIEVGPGKVLTGLVKRICPQMALENVNGIAGFSC